MTATERSRALRARRKKDMVRLDLWVPASQADRVRRYVARVLRSSAHQKT